MVNQLSKIALFIRSPQAIIYQLSNGPSQQYINCVVRIMYFTVVIYVYLIVLYLFYIKQLFTNLFSLHFQTKDGDMHAYVHSWLPHDGDRNQQNNQLLHPFLCNIFLYWLTIPFIGIYNVFIDKFIWGELNQQTKQHTCLCMLYNNNNHPISPLPL